jgi:hypothetical protein
MGNVIKIMIFTALNKTNFKMFLKIVVVRANDCCYHSESFGLL